MTISAFVAIVGEKIENPISVFLVLKSKDLNSI